MNFDAFADHAGRFVSRAPFFAACVAIVLLWAPSIFVIGNVDTWQLIINTLTTIVTFLLVALLQNTQTRFEDATNAKLNAIAEGLADLIAYRGDENAQADCEKLRKAVGLEHKPA